MLQLPQIPLEQSISPRLRDFLTSLRDAIQDTVGVDKTPPDEVTGLTATTKSSGVQLTWNKARGADSYRVYCAKGSSLFSSAVCIQTLQRPDNVSFFYVGGQSTSGSSLTFWVTSLSASGTESAIGTPASSSDNGPVAVGSITNTLIADDAISTPKLQANAVTAAKIDVTDLFAQTITATGTITGATLQTATSGTRIVIDSTNGLRAYSGSTLKTQIALSGTVATIQTTAVQGFSGGAVELLHGNTNGSNLKYFLSGSGVHSFVGSATGGYTIARFTRTTAAADVAMFNVAEDDSTNQTFFAINDTNDTAKTAAFLYFNGTLYRVKVDNSDLGSGTKQYLYLNGTT